MSQSADGRSTDIPQQQLSSNASMNYRTFHGAQSQPANSGVAMPETTERRQTRPQDYSQWSQSAPPPLVQSNYSSLAGAMTERARSPDSLGGRPSSNRHAPAAPHAYVQPSTSYPLYHGHYNSATHQPRHSTSGAMMAHPSVASSALSGGGGGNDRHARHPTPPGAPLTNPYQRADPDGFHARRRTIPPYASSQPDTRSLAPDQRHNPSRDASPLFNMGGANASQPSWNGPGTSYGTTESYTSNVEQTAPNDNFTTHSHFNSSSTSPTGLIYPFSRSIIPSYPYQHGSRMSYPSFPLSDSRQQPPSGIPPVVLVAGATHSSNSLRSRPTDTTWRGLSTTQNMDALPINPSTQPYTLGHGLHAAGANWTSLTNPYPLCANSDSRASSPSTSKHAGHFPPSVNTASSSSLTRLRSEPERLLTTRKRYQSPPESEPVAAPRRRTVDEISDTVYEVPTDDNDSDRRPVYPVHVHVVNVLCPHPECWAPSVVEEPGASPSRVYHCAYVDPRTGVACASDFKRRGCIDRHASSHSGRESKAVASGYLTPALARRLIWETINLVETSNWSCLQTTLTSSINLEEDEKAAKRAVEAEFDLKVLREQTAAIRAQIIRYGDEERAHPQSGPYNPINAVDLSNASQFSRLMIKRASTFERYYCSHRRCDADFTRVDALIRHERSCHKSKAGTNSAARAEAGPLGRGDSGPVQRQSAEAEDDWISSTSS